MEKNNYFSVILEVLYGKALNPNKQQKTLQNLLNHFKGVKKQIVELNREYENRMDLLFSIKENVYNESFIQNINSELSQDIPQYAEKFLHIWENLGNSLDNNESKEIYKRIFTKFKKDYYESFNIQNCVQEFKKMYGDKNSKFLLHHTSCEFSDFISFTPYQNTMCWQEIGLCQYFFEGTDYTNIAKNIDNLDTDNWEDCIYNISSNITKIFFKKVYNEIYLYGLESTAIDKYGVTSHYTNKVVKEAVNLQNYCVGQPLSADNLWYGFIIHDTEY